MDDNILVTVNDPKSVAAEMYRTLRTNIQFSTLDTPRKLIALTSAFPGEGKSTTAMNLAVTFAQNRNRTLLLELDLRKPSIGRVNRLVNNKGFVDLIQNPELINEVITDSGIENLDIILSGHIPPNPTEILMSNRTEKIFQMLRQIYDVVIIDCPPVLPVSDAIIISRLTDGLVLVTTYGISKKAHLKAAKDALEKANARVLGVVINQIEDDESGSGYYYYGNYSYGDMKQEVRPPAPKNRRGAKPKVSRRDD